MRSLEFWKAVVVDESNFLGGLVALLAREGARYCVIGGQAVNAYVEPLVSLDLDLAVAAEDLPRLEDALRASFRLERFAHSLNVSLPGSDLRAQVQTDSRYAGFVSRAAPLSVLGVTLPVAAVDDVLRGKVWAALAGRANARRISPTSHACSNAFRISVRRSRRRSSTGCSDGSSDTETAEGRHAPPGPFSLSASVSLRSAATILDAPASGSRAGVRSW
jgi:hypothetical protein